MSDPFIHLHLHTEYSLLDGAVRIKDLVARAEKLKMPAVAMTDHGNIFGAIDFYMAAKKAGIKPIIGCEAYLTPPGVSMHHKKAELVMPGSGKRKRRNSHITLLASNHRGFENLTKIVSKAHLEGFYHKPRIDVETLAEHSEGLICLSGCITGEINQFIQADDFDNARKSVGKFRDIFGPERFFLEMHDHGLAAQTKCNKHLMEYAKEFDLGLVAANDVHFLNKKDHEAHDIMICIGTGNKVLTENRMHYSPEVYMKSTPEMKKLFRHCPEAIANTYRIAEMCDLEIKLDATSSAKYPQFDSPDGSDRSTYFRRVCFEGLVARYGEERASTDPELRERLNYEIGVMEKMGFISYFLITWDFVKWAKDNDVPVGPGRGSAAGSLVAYVLEITDLCPIRFGLIFERFLNPERVSPPDIDIDFCQTRRPEVIEYVRRKYGESAVSHIVTFGTMGAKSVIRDVGRVMDMSFTESNRLAKMIPSDLGTTLADAKKKNPELKAEIENNDRVNQLWGYATFLEGLTRNTGIHAAGVVIGDRDLSEYVALTAGKEGEVVTQYAMNPLTELGMLKMDFLGLKTLTVIKDSIDLIHEHAPDFDLAADDLCDPPAFALLSRGETVGVFQLESGGMMNLCKQFDVNRIEDIIALIALYRPGPMDLIPDFIDRKKGKKKVTYLHPLIEEASKETFGILIYQEQVQRAANLLAGYSLGEADLLRRAMGKKKIEVMIEQRELFVKGCKETNNIPEQQANDIFDLLEKFAGYGFNKSHSAAYGLITYQTALLKANYPVEFMCGLLCNEINNTEKISTFVAECQRMGLRILPPDVNRSALKFRPEEIGSTDIRFGLAAVKNVGQAAMAAAIKEREANGEFSSLEDFAERLDSKTVNKKILESLIKAGAFDWTGERRDEMFSRVGLVISTANAQQKEKASGQVSLFEMEEMMATPAPTHDYDEIDKVEWGEEEYLTYEKELLGFYVTGHPLDKFRATIAAMPGGFADLSNLEELSKKGKNKIHKFACLISGVDVKYTKREGKAFAVVRLEDFSGSSEMMVWNEVFIKRTVDLVKGNVVQIKAKIEEDSRTEAKRLTAEDLITLPLNPDAPPVEMPANVVPMPATLPQDGCPALQSAVPVTGTRLPGAENAVVLALDAMTTTEADLEAIREAAARTPGDRPLHLRIRQLNGKMVTLEAGPEFAVTATFSEEPEVRAFAVSA